ncbi:hypothetical protein JYT36_00865 [Bacteroidales bacterium AH-315-N07]|nr:hypothetical protein [Bacteroidales bacterium AH-315-N07]
MELWNIGIMEKTTLKIQCLSSKGGSAFEGLVKPKIPLFHYSNVTEIFTDEFFRLFY